MSQPYGRHGYSAGAEQQPGGYGSAYGQGGGAGYSYSAPTPGYGSAYGTAGVPDAPGMYQRDDNGKDSAKKSLAVQALNKNVFIWAGFFTVSLFVYFFLSGGDFSFLMTYGAMSRMFGFGVLNVKIWTGKRATGVSSKTLQLYTLVFILRLSSILRHEGYLPYDKSGDWLYHFIEFLALASTAGALYGCQVPFSSTYQKDLDIFGEKSVPPGYGAVYLVAPTFILAVLFHPNLNSDFLSDFAWTFAMYLESVALIPQLYMFQKPKTGVVELLTAHFVFALGFGRLLEFSFWIFSYHELATSSGSRLPGYISIFSQFMQLLLMIDFFYYYYLALKNQTPLVLPSHSAMNVV